MRARKSDTHPNLEDQPEKNTVFYTSGEAAWSTSVVLEANVSVDFSNIRSDWLSYI